MEWARLVELVGRVRATSKKGEKVALIADLLRQTRGRETELARPLPHRDAAAGPHRDRLEDARARDALGARGRGAPDARARGRGLVGRRGGDRAPAPPIAGCGRCAPLLESTDEAGRRLLVELLLGEVRQGALEGLVIEAIARASGLAPVGRASRPRCTRRASGELARAALEEGAAGLGRFSLRLLSPVAPMLASPAGDAEEALERLGEAAFEYKLDGARLQVHRAGDEVRVFTRQLQDVTARVPEVVEWARALPVREAVVEGEALALRPDGRPRPFQETMRRLGRSKDVEAARRALPLSSFFFDALYLEGEGPLVALPYADAGRAAAAARRARVAPAAGRDARSRGGRALLRAGPRGRATRA